MTIYRLSKVQSNHKRLSVAKELTEDERKDGKWYSFAKVAVVLNINTASLYDCVCHEFSAELRRGYYATTTCRGKASYLRPCWYMHETMFDALNDFVKTHSRLTRKFSDFYREYKKRNETPVPQGEPADLETVNKEEKIEEFSRDILRYFQDAQRAAIRTHSLPASFIEAFSILRKAAKLLGIEKIKVGVEKITTEKRIIRFDWLEDCIKTEEEKPIVWTFDQIESYLEEVIARG